MTHPGLGPNAQQRVTVRCCRCDTVASLLAPNLATWRAMHVCRNDDTRPLGWYEAQAQRERAATGTVDASATASGASAAIAPPLSPCPHRCDECGAELTAGEAARSDWARGTKYEGYCNDCCLLRAGLR